MKRALAAAGLIALCAVVALAVFAARDPLLKRDLEKAPGEAAKWVVRTAKSVARSVELASRPDVIEPVRYRWNGWANTFDLTLYRYVSTNPWITDGASLTFRFPRDYVLVNLVAGSGAVPEVPIEIDYDTSRRPTCGKDCKRSVGASIGFRAAWFTLPPSDEKLATAVPMPEGGVPRRQMMGKTLYKLGERHCDFALYETDDRRDDRLPSPFDRARIFHRDAAAGTEALTVECWVGNVGGTCWTVADYDLGARLKVSFPLPLLCETDEILRRARAIFDDHLIARTGPVPGWGRVEND